MCSGSTRLRTMRRRTSRRQTSVGFRLWYRVVSYASYSDPYHILQLHITVLHHPGVAIHVSKALTRTPKKLWRAGHQTPPVIGVGMRPSRLGYSSTPDFHPRFLLLTLTQYTMSNKRKQERVFIIGVGCTAFIKPRGTRTTNDVRHPHPSHPTCAEYRIVDGAGGCDEGFTGRWDHV